MSIKSKLQALRSGVSFFGLVVAFSSQYYPAHAGAGTITVKDSAGATQTFDVVTDGSGNFVQKSVICDVAAAANCASVSAGNALFVSAVGGTATIGVVSALLLGGTATVGSINAIVSSLPGGTATLGAVIPGVIGSWGLTSSTTPSSAPTNALVGGVVYSSTQPTLTTGQSIALQGDSRGNLMIGNTSGFTVFVSNATTLGPATALNSSPVTVDTSVEVAQNAAAGASLLQQGGVYTSTPATLTTAHAGQIQLSARGGVLAGSQYPAGAIPISAPALGTTGVVTATLAGLTLATTYMCTMSVRSNANAAATGTVIVTGPSTTLTYAHWTGVNSLGMGVTEMIFSPCLPASAAGANIVISSPAPGTGGVVSIDATGYNL